MRNIEIDEEVYKELKKRAIPFEDKTPNDVLRKLLGITNKTSINDNVSDRSCSRLTNMLIHEKNNNRSHDDYVRKMINIKGYGEAHRNEKSGVEESYTGKTPVSFTFLMETFTIRKWKELLLKLCEILYDKHGNEFVGIALSINPRGNRPYFTKTKEEMESAAVKRGSPKGFWPLQVKNANIYAETKLGANRIIRVCRELLSRLGYDDSELLIKTTG
ncbi:MAG: hypothetical protein AB1742_13065 [bacterium]